MRFKNVCPKSGVSPTIQIRGPKPFFSKISQLDGKFNGLYLRKKSMIYIIGKVLPKLREVFYVVSKRHELSSINGLKLDRHFYPPSVKLILHSIQCQLRVQRSANGTSPNFAKRWTVNRANDLQQKSRGGFSLPKNWEQKTLYICPIFRRL